MEHKITVYCLMVVAVLFVRNTTTAKSSISGAGHYGALCLPVPLLSAIVLSGSCSITPVSIMLFDVFVY
jgi:hypothetical protein